MNAPLKADNLNVEYTEHGLRVEPAYLSYLRSHDYIIERVHSVQVVHRKESETAHLVCKVDTYHFPKTDSKLDVALHRTTQPMCDCWKFRQESADISHEGVSPAESGLCPHIKIVYKEHQADADESQATLA